MTPVAVVTGAASGIGEAIANRLYEDGWNLMTVDIRGDVDLRVNLTTRRGNLQAIEATVANFGQLDAVVANAGFQHVSPIAEFPEDRWDAIVALLLTSPFLLAKAAWPYLQASGEGRFVGIASVHAKHGLLGLVKTLALEGADSGISATAVCPGYVRTPLVEGQIEDQARAHGMSPDRVLEDVILASQPMKRLIEPADVADVVALLLRPEGRAFTGSPVVMDHGWTAR